MIDVENAARLLIAARSGAQLPLGAVEPSDLEEAFAVQEATVAALGGCGGWKVGAASPTATPTFAPLPRIGIRSAEEPWVSRTPWVAVEVEIAFRVARTIVADLADRLDEPAVFAETFDAAMVAVEIVETRLADRILASPLAKAADLLTHGALVIGPPLPLHGLALDFASVTARLDIDGRDSIETTAGNPAGDPVRLLRPLARHCVERRLPLRPGQIVTTGSCTGLAEIDPATDLTATIGGLGRIRPRIVAAGRRPEMVPATGGREV
ncbi:MAG: hydratase [Siculibacillus sp.]|nr:hydratase [Siculibacillus sp.]